MPELESEEFAKQSKKETWDWMLVSNFGFNRIFKTVTEAVKNKPSTRVDKESISMVHGNIFYKT